MVPKDAIKALDDGVKCEASCNGSSPSSVKASEVGNGAGQALADGLVLGKLLLMVLVLEKPLMLSLVLV